MINSSQKCQGHKRYKNTELSQIERGWGHMTTKCLVASWTRKKTNYSLINDNVSAWLSWFCLLYCGRKVLTLEEVGGRVHENSRTAFSNSKSKIISQYNDKQMHPSISLTHSVCLNMKFLFSLRLRGSSISRPQGRDSCVVSLVGDPRKRVRQCGSENWKGRKTMMSMSISK